jgi:nucleoside-specific outer membrane channel protein Tsx
MRTLRKAVLAGAAATAAVAGSGAASAAEWSDTTLGYRYGTEFREPFNTQKIQKDIFFLTHASGYKYGTNFFNVDFLMSDSKDPSTVGGSGAQEAYVVYRNTLDFGKISGKDLKWGWIRGWGLTGGFDWNTKNDVGYASKKRMWVLGPTVMWDVPGFFNMSVLVLDESNAPVGHPSRYRYKTHAMLTGAWGIPIGSTPLSFEGFFNYIGSKGKDEFGAQTKPETNIDMQLMLDVGALAGGPKSTFKVGLEYQYWKNKFGNDASGPAGSGAFAKTPMIRVEYHF